MRKVVPFILFLCGYLCLTQALQHEFPAHFPRCKRYDPKLNECLLKATEQLRPDLIKGIRQIGLPSVDPLSISEITLEQGTQALNFKALLTDIKVKGLGQYKFSQFDFDVEKLEWFCKMTIGNLLIDGRYTVTGKVLLAPIAGNGTFTAGIEGVNVTAIQRVKLIKKNGVEYAEPIFTNTSIDVGNPRAKLDGLFDGSPELNQVTNTVISDNVDILFEDLKPVIEKVISNILEQYLLTIESNIPFDKLYPKEA